MAFLANDHGPVDPEVTERFLAGMAHVISAETWMKGESMLARVTVTQDAKLCEYDLLQACLNSIGPHQTPKAIWLERRVKPAA